MNDFKALMLRWNAGSKTRLQEPSQYSQNKGNPLQYNKTDDFILFF